jgi:hypothetical protein
VVKVRDVEVKNPSQEGDVVLDVMGAVALEPPKNKMDVMV